ncbi:MAG: flagellar biosynthesis protein FlgH [Myxococcales bacterium]|nr:flagellar biosynthesis protein FlgH [Myxococcales bacterium]
MKRLFVIVALGAMLGTSCGVRHVKPYEVKRRQYKPLEKPEAPLPKKTDGSVWQTGASGGTLFTDVRAFAKNDIVTIRIEETASATRASKTMLGRNSSLGMGASVIGVFGTPGSNGQSNKGIAGANAEKSVESGGETSRKDEVRFTIAATVTRVLANGNLYLEGHRVVLVNEEEHHFHISGVARPEDIEQDNKIPSYKLAEAHVEFTGRGNITNEEQAGWLGRFLHHIWPF